MWSPLDAAWIAAEDAWPDLDWEKLDRQSLSGITDEQGEVTLELPSAVPVRSVVWVTHAEHEAVGLALDAVHESSWPAVVRLEDRSQLHVHVSGVPDASSVATRGAPTRRLRRGPARGNRPTRPQCSACVSSHVGRRCQRSSYVRCLAGRAATVGDLRGSPQRTVGGSRSGGRRTRARANFRPRWIGRVGSDRDADAERASLVLSHAWKRPRGARADRRSCRRVVR